MCTQGTYQKSIHELEDLKYTNVNLRERLAKAIDEIKGVEDQDKNECIRII